MTQKDPISAEELVAVSKKTLTYSYYSMARANRFFVYYFLPYHQLYNVSIQEFLNHCEPIVNHVFSLVNEADDVIEAAQRGEIGYSGVHPWKIYTRDLMLLLKHLNSYDEKIDQELNDNLIRYWDLENQMMHDRTLTPDMLLEAIDLRASDITATHHICERLLGVAASADRIEATRACEILMEIESDLTEYVTDVRENNYNCYRMFVRLYGSQAPQHMEQERERRLQILHARVAALPASEQGAFKRIFASWEAYYKDRYGTFTSLDRARYRNPDFYPRAPIPQPILES